MNVPASPQGYCAQCGAPNYRANRVCAGCGATLPWAQGVAVTNDAPSVILNIISLLIPLVGLILFLVFMQSAPRRAREAGISALVGVVLLPLTLLLMTFLLRP